MTDRPIIFSAAMVRALLAGTKTQTRRLATSPLRRVEVGDRLYAREHWRVSSAQDKIAPRDLPHELTIEFIADGVGYFDGKHRQGMHMPRWASRLTLIVEGVKIEPLQAITEADAIAEGVTPIQFSTGPNFYSHDVEYGSLNYPTATRTYQSLWDHLHGEGAWAANPDVMALTFRVERRNIDQ